MNKIKYKIKHTVAKMFQKYIYLYTANCQRRKPIRLLTAEKTRKLICEGYSISRFGDGELNIVLGSGGIDFQDVDPDLQRRMEEILKIGVDKNEKFGVALAPTLQEYEEYSKGHKNFWVTFNLFKRRKILKLIDTDSVYFDAFCARCYGIYQKETKESVFKRFSELQKVWEKKDVLIVEGSKTCLGVGNDLLYNIAGGGEGYEGYCSRLKMLTGNMIISLRLSRVFPNPIFS